jgi:ElaB/YqjD/DUF883 family membrane-anchored ribosome-binding protein
MSTMPLDDLQENAAMTPSSSNTTSTPTGSGNGGSTGVRSTGALGNEPTASMGTDVDEDRLLGASPSRQMKDHLSEAGSHLKQATRDAGSAVKSAASAAGEELRLGRANVKAGLSDSAVAGLSAAEQAAAASREQMDVLMDKGRDLLDSAAELIRERPLASFGVAFATGWLIAKLARGGGGDR